MASVKLAALVAWLTLTAAVAFSQPSYVSRHFEVYDYAGAGQSYLQAVAEALEEAYAAVVSRGVSLAKPCSGIRYVVNVVQMPGGEQGFTKAQLRIGSGGRIADACIVWVNISAGLDQRLLRATVHHELVHVAQASYYRYVSVAQARPWYVEASAEGFGSALSGVCVWAPYYFTYELYRYNPYRFSGSDVRCYALGAFYYWVLATGYSSMDEALRSSLSGEGAVSSWVNDAYRDFLLSLTRGLVLCGRRYEPEFTRVSLLGGSWTTTLALDGLSAAYLRIELPAPGPILVTVTGDVRSNIALGQPFITRNTSLLIALVNPSLEPINVGVTIQYRPPLEVKVVKGVFDGWSGSLELTLYVLYAGRPVTGLIDVNGVPVEASNGYARIALQGVTWGRYVIKVSHGEAEYSVQVSVARPALSLATTPTLYLSSTGRGEVRLSFRNPGDVAVRARVALEAPPFIQAETAIVEAPIGEASFGLPFSVNSTPFPATLRLRVCYAPDDCAQLQLSVSPVELRVLRARYDSTTNTTRVEALAEPANLRLTAVVKGLGGAAWFKHSTYYVGWLNVSLPPPVVELAVTPVLVAPSWLILRVNATVKAADPRPLFDVSYALNVVVNGAPLGSVDFAHGETRTLSSVVNFTYAGASLTLEGPFVEPALFRVPKPVLQIASLDWHLDDEGSVARIEVSVSGPCRFLVLGREVANESLTLERRLKRGARTLTLDLGFETFLLEMPGVELELIVPPVALAGLPVNATLVLRTAARVNATVAVLMDGEEVEHLRIVKLAADAARATVALMPQRPGVYNVAARSWFANASASLLYVRVRELRVEAPRLALIGSRAPVRAALILEPPVTPLVNVMVRGCDSDLELELEANSTTLLGIERVCRALVEARFLNYTAFAVMYWDVLTLTFERVLGIYDGGLIVPNGTLKPIALFANATPAPAKTLVDGQPELTISKPGGYSVKLEAELWGMRNETTVTVYVVPEELYVSAAELLRELGEPPHLASSLRLAVLSGRWERMKSFVNTYTSARRATPEPIAALAAALAERWARDGGEAYLDAAQALLALRPTAYLVLLVAVGATFTRRARRKEREASSSESEGARRPSS